MAAPPTRTVLLATAAVAALAVAWALRTVGVRDSYARARGGWDIVPIAAAAADLDAGTILTAAMIEPKSLPGKFVTPNVLGPASVGEVIGERALIPIKKGDPLYRSALGRIEAGAGSDAGPR
jgi:Flp pilus assembly protein CpaB